MAETMKYWRPGLRVWWRRDGEAQLGLDPPALLFGLSKADHDLLDALSRGDPQLDCWTVAMGLGWSREDFAAFTRRLPEHALVDSPTQDATPVLRYWSMAAASGAPHSTHRFTARVVIDGLDPLGLFIARAVLTAGTGALFLSDERPVTRHDVGPDAFRPGEVGEPRASAAAARLRPQHPGVGIHAGAPSGYAHSRTPPAPIRGRDAALLFAPGLRSSPAQPEAEPEDIDLAVIVTHGALEPRRTWPYAAREVPILPVTVRELDVSIGPLLARPGPCVRCMHLTLAGADPRWPAVATQLACEPNLGIDPVVLDLASAVAAHQVTAITDRRPSVVVGTSMHVDGLHPVPRYQRWHPHPRCGCALEHLSA